LGDRANFQSHVYTRRLAYFQLQAFPRKSLEASSLKGDAVLSWLEKPYRVITRFIGFHTPDFVRLHVPHLDRTTGDASTALVNDSSLESGSELLRNSGACKAQNDGEGCEDASGPHTWSPPNFFEFPAVRPERATELFLRPGYSDNGFPRHISVFFAATMTVLRRPDVLKSGQTGSWSALDHFDEGLLPKLVSKSLPTFEKFWQSFGF
jgi:hypothetical protein